MNYSYIFLNFAHYYFIVLFNFREEKTELLTESREELEYLNELVSKLKSEVCNFVFFILLCWEMPSSVLLLKWFFNIFKNSLLKSAAVYQMARTSTMEN